MGARRVCGFGLRLLRRILGELQVWLIGLPTALCVLLLRPFVHIRVGMANTSRIGDSMSIFFSCCRQASGQAATVDFHYVTNDLKILANEFWWGKMKPRLRIMPAFIGRNMFAALKKLHGGGRHLFGQKVDNHLLGSRETLDVMIRHGDGILTFSVSLP